MPQNSIRNCETRPALQLGFLEEAPGCGLDSAMLVSGADDHRCPCPFMFFLGVTTSRKLPNSFSTAGIW